MRIPYDRSNEGQQKFHADLKTRFAMISGGLGSGKSFALMMKALQLSAVNQDMPGGLLCPTIKEFKRDMLPLFRETCDRYVQGWRYHKTDLYFQFPWSTAPLYIFTAEADIKGPNLAYALINEYSSMEWARIQQLINRVRVKGAKLSQIAMAGTPDDEYLWLEEFIEKQTKASNLNLIEVATYQNKHTAEGYVQLLKDTLDEKSYQLFVEGKRIRLTGDLFYYAYEPKVNDYPVEYDPELAVYANLDFNVGNMSTTLAHVVGSGRNKQMLFFGEIILTDQGSDTEAMGRALLARFPADKLLLTVDASAKSRKTSGTSDVKILEKLGLTVRYRSQNPRLRKRQLLVNGLLSHRNILLNATACPKFKRDLLRVEQDKVNFEKKKDKPELTHTSDTLDYLADFEFQDWLGKEEREGFFVKHL